MAPWNVRDDAPKNRHPFLSDLERRDTGLEQEEKDKLSEIGKRLGNADMEAQIRSLDLYLEELKKSMEEKREGMKTRIRLCHCLGVMSGIFLTILLV